MIIKQLCPLNVSYLTSAHHLPSLAHCNFLKIVFTCIFCSYSPSFLIKGVSLAALLCSYCWWKLHPLGLFPVAKLNELLVLLRFSIYFCCLYTFLYNNMYMKVKVLATQSCPTLGDPMDCSPPGSSIHGIFQARYWSGVPLPSSFCLHVNPKKQPSIYSIIII